MQIQHNPPRRSALIWTAIIVVGIFIVFFPNMIGMDGFNGGFALSCLGGFIAMIGIIAAIIYFNLAKSLDRITQKENVLAHWNYSAHEWQKYTEVEHQEDSSMRKNLFLMITAISVVVGFLFWVVVRENPGIIFLLVLGIIAITGFTAWITGLTNYRNNKRNLGEVFIALDGAYLNHQVHIWKGLGNKLEEIAFESQYREQPRIRIEYSSPSRGGRNSYTARIPVPPGQEDLAQMIVDKITAAHLKAGKVVS
jgi:amino acid transporter